MQQKIDLKKDHQYKTKMIWFSFRTNYFIGFSPLTIINIYELKLRDDLMLTGQATHLYQHILAYFFTFL